MATQEQLDRCYMVTAMAHAGLSKARRKKVGSCIVTAQGVILGDAMKYGVLECQVN